MLTIDPARLKQVAYNYLSNALKFTPERRPRHAAGHAARADQFRLEVEDTGIGIAPADLGRLFVEFQQLEAGAAKRHQGTGLGLALTRRLVEAQGGSVGVESAVGAGSVFWAILPLIPVALLCPSCRLPARRNPRARGGRARPRLGRPFPRGGRLHDRGHSQR